MTTKMAKKVANLFRGDDCYRPQIKEVCVVGQYVYATDSLTAIRIRRDDDSPDEIPERNGKKFPFADIDRMCDRSETRTEPLPFIVPVSSEEKYLIRSRKVYNERLAEKRREIKDIRDTLTVCPCCGEAIYIYDGEARAEEYVNAMEAEPVDMHGFDHVVHVLMRERKVLMQYEFIHRAVNAVVGRKAMVCVARNIGNDDQKYDMVRVDATDMTIFMMPMIDDGRHDIMDVIDFNTQEED